MKWFQIDSDTPNDPKILAVRRELGTEGFGGLVLLWCHIADHGKRPGWSVDSRGRPFPEADLIAASGLNEPKWRDLVRVCVSVGHFLKKPWNQRQVIAIPAMARRSDTYTQRRVRTHVEQSSNGVRTNYRYKTTQDKTVHTKEERTPRSARHGLPAGDPKKKVIRALVRDIVQKADPHAGFGDLKELAKAACAKFGLTYEAESVGSALEQALARKSKAS